MERNPTPRIDIGLSAFLIAACCAVLWESRKIPPGSFEPLGSAPVPQAVAALIIVLCLVVMLQAFAQLRRGPGDDAGDDAGEALVLRPAAAAAVFALTVGYVLVLAFALVSFAIATTVFLCVTIGMLTDFRPRALAVALVVGLVMGFGCQYLFTQVFVVDLPAGR